MLLPLWGLPALASILVWSTLPSGTMARHQRTRQPAKAFLVPDRAKALDAYCLDGSAPCEYCLHVDTTNQPIWSLYHYHEVDDNHGYHGHGGDCRWLC